MYYVLDCSDNKYFLFERYELYRFVESEGTVFGNYLQQKRCSSIKKSFFGQFFVFKKVIKHIKYIAYDEFFNLIDYEVLEGWVYNHKANYKQLDYKRNGDHTFRSGPVKGTGGYPSGDYFRRVQTTQEKRLNCDPDYSKYARSKRVQNLPSSWDDVCISANNNKRSWKKNKKRKQWM